MKHMIRISCLERYVLDGENDDKSPAMLKLNSYRIGNNDGHDINPRKGDTVNITINNYRTWLRPILFESGKRLNARDGQVYLGDDLICDYTFRNDWYFLGGDNVLDSRDSRYFGLVPEEYIVGIVAFVGKDAAEHRR